MNSKKAPNDDLITVLSVINEKSEMRALLEDLFTVSEIRDASQRLRVARLLTEEKSYIEIEELTGSSATTIARVSKCLSAGSGGYLRALEEF